MKETYVPPSHRYIRIALIGVTTAGALLLCAVCAAFSSVASRINLTGNESPTPYIVITGTVSVIAGMPIPADGVLQNQTLRESGGTFDYTTNLRPPDIYNFYVAILTQRSIWRAGRRSTITDTYARMYFWPDLPRLTIITVNCDPDLCAVHVDY